MPAAVVPTPPWAAGSWSPTAWEEGTWGGLLVLGVLRGAHEQSQLVQQQLVQLSAHSSDATSLRTGSALSLQQRLRTSLREGASLVLQELEGTS